MTMITMIRIIIKDNHYDDDYDDKDNYYDNDYNDNDNNQLPGCAMRL